MTADQILHQSVMQASEKEKVSRAFRSRAAAARAEASWRTRACPGCGQGLKLKLLGGEAGTLFVCAGCSFTHHVPFLMDEARPAAESFVPGVTGKRTQTIVVNLGDLKTGQGASPQVASKH
jgi:hypothetical protein